MAVLTKRALILLMVSLLLLFTAVTIIICGMLPRTIGLVTSGTLLNLGNLKVEAVQAKIIQSLMLILVGITRVPVLSKLPMISLSSFPMPTKWLGT